MLVLRDKSSLSKMIIENYLELLQHPVSDVSGLMREPKIQLYLEFLVYATLTRRDIFS